MSPLLSSWSHKFLIPGQDPSFRFLWVASASGWRHPLVSSPLFRGRFCAVGASPLLPIFLVIKGNRLSDSAIRRQLQSYGRGLWILRKGWQLLHLSHTWWRGGAITEAIYLFSRNHVQRGGVSRWTHIATTYQSLSSAGPWRLSVLCPPLSQGLRAKN